MAGITLLTHALLIDGTGREPVEDATVAVEGSVIKDVVPSGRVGPLAIRRMLARSSLAVIGFSSWSTPSPASCSRACAVNAPPDRKIRRSA